MKTKFEGLHYKLISKKKRIILENKLEGVLYYFKEAKDAYHFKSLRTTDLFALILMQMPLESEKCKKKKEMNALIADSFGPKITPSISWNFLFATKMHLTEVTIALLNLRVVISSNMISADS